MNTQLKYKQLQIRYRKSGAAFIILDVVGRNNILNKPTMEEFEDAIEILKNDKNVLGIGLVSGKPSHFCLGADLLELYKSNDRAKISDMVVSGQNVFNALTKLNKPFVVAINGHCYGGGLELSLCASYRIATNDPKTQLGLPEVKLGLIPALGGTQRLPRLVGYKNSVELILGSSTVSSAKALEIGLVDLVVEPDDLLKTFEEKIVELACDDNLSKLNRNSRLEDEKTIGKLLNLNKRVISMKLKGRYKAYEEVLNCLETGFKDGIEAGLLKEQEAFTDLALKPETKNQIFLSFTNEFSNQQTSQICQQFKLNDVKSIGIIGTGLMGVSIASLAIRHGISVKIKPYRDIDPEHYGDNLKDLAKHNNVNVIENYDDFSDVDTVIECVKEDFAVKVGVINKLLENPNLTVLTNTSSLKVGDLANALNDSRRFLGLHLFNPVALMPLAEVIPQPDADPVSIAKAYAVVKTLGKTAVAVSDSPCFLMNRIILSYLLALCWCAYEGYSVYQIEEAAVDFGMPIGPIALFDEIGMDLAFKAIDALEKQGVINQDMLPDLLHLVRAMKLSGRYGRNGIYLYDEHLNNKGFNFDVLEKLKVNLDNSKADPETIDILTKKLIFPMVNEASYCLSEKIVKKAKEIDLASVLGIGFPSYYGGLLKFADSYGIAEIVESLQTNNKYLVKAGKISPILVEMADSHKTFYPH